jgi:hypothetical protein
MLLGWRYRDRFGTQLVSAFCPPASPPFAPVELRGAALLPQRRPPEAAPQRRVANGPPLHGESCERLQACPLPSAPPRWRTRKHWPACRRPSGPPVRRASCPRAGSARVCRASGPPTKSAKDSGHYRRCKSFASTYRWCLSQPECQQNAVRSRLTETTLKPLVDASGGSMMWLAENAGPDDRSVRPGWRQSSMPQGCCPRRLSYQAADNRLPACARQLDS